MKRAVLILILLFPASAAAQSPAVFGWSTMPTWHAEYRSGSSRTVVDTVADRGQRIQAFSHSKLMATRYVIWGGTVTGSWVKYAGLDQCYRKSGNVARWQLEREAMSLAMSKTEFYLPDLPTWDWQARSTGWGWSFGTGRSIGPDLAEVTVSGTDYGRLIRVRVRSGERVRQSSSTRVRALVQLEVGPPILVCSTTSRRLS